MTDVPQWALERAKDLAALWNDPGQEEAIARALVESAFTFPLNKSLTLVLDSKGDLHVSSHDLGSAVVTLYGFVQENIDARNARLAVSLPTKPEAG